ncbi:MAG TPA: hypothetical protein VIK99_09260 [Thermaerobacter sp.]
MGYKMPLEVSFPAVPTAVPEDEAFRFWRDLADPATLTSALNSGQPLRGFRVTVNKSDLGEDAVAIGALTMDCELAAGPSGAEAAFRLTFYPGRAAPWLRWLPPRDLIPAARELLAAWPEGRKIVLLNQDSSVETRVYLVPDRSHLPGRWRNRRSAAAPVVFTALWLVLRGVDPREAIRRAHAEPEACLASGVHFRRGIYWMPFTMRWPAGPLSLPPEYAWLAGPGAEQAWRQRHLIDGFRIEIGEAENKRDAFGALRVQCDSGEDRAWLDVGKLDRCVITLPHQAQIAVGATMPWWDSPRARQVLRDHREQFPTVLRSWPAGQKALVFSGPDALRRGVLGSPNCRIALRFHGLPAEAVLDVFTMAMWAAAQGASEQELRDWLGSLTREATSGLHVLRELAVP